MAAVWWQLGKTIEALPRETAGEGLETSYAHSWPGAPWIVVLALTFAAILVVACYWRERGDAGKFARVSLATIRIALLLLLAWMIYGWARQRHRTDLPDLIVIIDDSESMATVDQWEDEQVRRDFLDRLTTSGQATNDGDPTRLRLTQHLLLDTGRPWQAALESRYRVKWFLAGETLRPLGALDQGVDARLRELAPTQSASRLGQAVLDVLQLQRGRPTAAILLVTDGITTEGPSVSEAAQQARRRQTPLFVVGVGSEQAPRDVRLAELRVDEVAFVRDVLHFDVQLSSQGYGGKAVRLRLLREGEAKPLVETTVTLDKDHAPQTARLSYRPTTEGRFEFTVEAEPLPGEVSTANNRLQREVTVTEESVRVLMVHSAPSYEFRYLKTLLGRSLNLGSQAGKKAIELRVLLQEADWEFASQEETSLRVFPVTREELFQYDVILLGDANPATLGANSLRHLADFVQTRGGGLVIQSGPRFMPRAYTGTPLADVLPFDPESSSTPDAEENLPTGFRPRLTALGAAAPTLQLADATAANLRLWQQLPPLYWLAEAADVKAGVRVLAEHPTRTSVEGKPLPVITLQFLGAGKVLWHGSDDFWRWSREPEFEAAYARYWLQWLRYLSRGKLQGSNRSVQITTEREEYQRGEPVRLRARFLDERTAPATDDGVTLVLEREGTGRRNVQLARDATDRGLFEAAVGQLVDGRYRVGLLRPALEEPPVPARFSVVAPPGEQARLEMDGADLRAAAKRSEGRFYTLRDVGTFLNDLPPGRQVRIESLPAEPLWNRWPLAALFVGLIVVEWIARKRLGML